MGISELQSSAIIAVGTSELIQWAKASPWCGFLTMETQKLNRIVSLVVAFLAGLGMSFHFDPDAHTLLISGLAWSSLTHGAQQWVAQQAWYRLAVTRNDATAVAVKTGPRTTVVETTTGADIGAH
jgi:hypothetical protein